MSKQRRVQAYKPPPRAPVKGKAKAVRVVPGVLPVTAGSKALLRAIRRR